MAKAFAKSFYNSKEWQKCRAAYISHRKSVDGGICETCHEKPGYIVHHKTELTPENINNPNIALNFDNLKYDCHICHNKEGKEKAEAVTGMIQYEFNSKGMPVVLPPVK